MGAPKGSINNPKGNPSSLVPGWKPRKPLSPEKLKELAKIRKRELREAIARLRRKDV